MSKALGSYRMPLNITLGCLLTVLLFLCSAQRADALSYEVPDRNNFTNGQNVYLEIAQPGNGVALDVEDAWAKLYWDPSVTPPIQLQIMDGDYSGCADRAIDSYGAGDAPCDDNGDVRYNFYYATGTNGSSREAAPFASVLSTEWSATDWHNKWQNPLEKSFPGGNVPTPPGGPIDTGGGVSRYVVYIQAIWETGGSGRINGFRIASKSAGGQGSLWSGGQPYAIQNRIDDNSSEGRFDFEFAPQCNAPTSLSVPLRWRDADAASLSGVPDDGSEFDGDNEISFDLYDGPVGSDPTNLILHIDSGTSPNIGGNGDYREINFDAKNDRVYRWRWNGVNRRNGVQMWMPFDTFYFAKNCPPPSGGDQGVQGRVFNDVNNNKQYDDGEPIFANPSSACGGGYSSVPATVTAAGNTGNLNVCNPDPLYKIPTPPGTQTANLNVPPGWTSTNGTSRIVDVPNGSYYSMTYAQWFGIRQARQGVQGRVFIDDNDDGYFNKYTDQIVRNPGNACSSSNVYVPGVTVTATPPNATGDLSVCNAGNGAFIYSPDLYALYQIETPPGSINVRVNVPAGWKINDRLGANRTQYVSNNNLTSMATVDEYFAILPDMPSVTPYCSNGNSFANISWPNSGMSISGHYVDIGTSSNFAPGTFSNRYVGGSTSVSGAPGSFSGNPTGQLVEGATYYARIYYQGPNVHSAVRQFTADRCPRLSCGTLQPTEAESNDPIDMRVSFNNIGQGQLAAGANLGVSYTGTPNYSNGNTAYSARPLPAGQTALSNSGAISFSQPAGDYTITWTVTGDPRANSLTGATACTGTIRVSDKPYFRAYGGDVVVGISQPPGTLSCPGWNSVAGSSIKAFTTSSGPGIGKGAGVQLAAFALGQIDGFSTTTGQMSATPPGAQGTGIFPKGLAFANKGSGSGNSTYGGGSELPWCPPDYFNTDSRPAAPSGTFLTALLTPLTGLASDSYFYDATMPPPFPLPGLYEFRLNNGTFKATCLPLLPCNNLGNDDRITVYVNGDVIIDGDITYDTSNWSVGKIPSLYVIAKGNIYIQPNVTQIDGVYIAQEGAPGTGRIYTCANGKNVPTQTFLVDSCRTKLTVNGTLIAQRLRLFRLNNSRLQSSPQELSGSPTIAEMVSFGPETWLTVPAPFPPSTIDGYDAATSLPPTL